MSHIVNVIVITSVDDASQGMSLLNKYIVNECRSEFVKASHYVFGRNMECDIFIAAANYLKIPYFIEFFYHIQWQYPDEVQLMIKDQDDLRFSVYVPGADK